MTVLTERFPTNISYGSSGGPAFKTTITVVDTGFEYANINWDQARHRYDVAMGVRTEEELSELIRFFHVTRGRAHHFRYKDWADYKSCFVNKDETLVGNAVIFGIGDGTTTIFNLSKPYTIGGVTNTRYITRPVNGTVKIWVDSVLQTETTHYDIDYDTGIVTFVTAPGNTLAITWGGQFDVLSRFDTDTLEVNLEFYGHGSSGVPIVEIKE